MRDLDLADRADVIVGDLSGGQRKRASIAVELLTRPRVFFLDEPTSGLDPSTAADVLGIVRRLARAGVTVVLTTHNPADIEACDRVVFLAPGGYLAFAGSPRDAREYFEVADLDRVYRCLAEEASPSANGRVDSRRIERCPTRRRHQIRSGPNDLPESVSCASG